MWVMDILLEQLEKLHAEEQLNNFDTASYVDAKATERKRFRKKLSRLMSYGKPIIPKPKIKEYNKEKAMAHFRRIGSKVVKVING